MTELDFDAIKRSLVVNRDSQNGWASRVVEDLVAEVERLRENAEARERVMRRENVILRTAERERDKLRADVRDAEKSAAACDQMIALLDGFPVSDPCPEAERVAVLLDEVRHLRAQRVLDNEEAARLYDFARDKGAALERDATVAYLLAPGTCCSPDVLAENIGRGDHRREEKP